MGTHGHTLSSDAAWHEPDIRRCESPEGQDFQIWLETSGRSRRSLWHLLLVCNKLYYTSKNSVRGASFLITSTALSQRRYDTLKIVSVSTEVHALEHTDRLFCILVSISQVYLDFSVYLSEPTSEVHKKSIETLVRSCGNSSIPKSLNAAAAA